jgi:hypothetical protein
MDPFDIVDVNDDGEFVSSSNGDALSLEEVEEFHEAGIEFTRKAEIEIRKVSGEFLKEQ